jgi:four helix bundle protein
VSLESGEWRSFELSGRIDTAAGFTRLEEIQVWQKARELTKMLYRITGNGRLERDFGLRDQMRRSAVSVMANIAEGFGRRSDKEFANFLNIAYGSASETLSHLYVALDLEYVTPTEFEDLSGKLDEVARMTFALGEHLRESSRGNSRQ